MELEAWNSGYSPRGTEKSTHSETVSQYIQPGLYPHFLGMLLETQKPFQSPPSSLHPILLTPLFWPYSSLFCCSLIVVIPRGSGLSPLLSCLPPLSWTQLPVFIKRAQISLPKLQNNIICAPITIYKCLNYISLQYIAIFSNLTMKILLSISCAWNVFFSHFCFYLPFSGQLRL